MDSNFVDTIRDIIKDRVGLDKNGLANGMDSIDMKSILKEVNKLNFTDTDSKFMLDLLKDLLGKYEDVKFCEDYC